MKKTIYFLLGILLIFVTVYFLLTQKEKKTFAPERMENFLQLDSALVDRVEFNRFGTRLILQKVNQLWYLVEPDSFRADKNAVGQLLSNGSHLRVEEMISSNREKQPFFMVDSVTGTRIDFFSGNNTQASVVVGKMTSDYMHAYLRKPNSDEVYLVMGLFTNVADRGINKWRDRGIFTFDPIQIKEIELGQGKEEFKLTQKDTLWQLSLYPYQESSPADGKLVDDYVQSLSNMKADEFARKPETEELDFQKPEFSLILTFGNGSQEKLFVTRKYKEGDRYFVKTEPDKNVFILFEYTFKRLIKKPEDFQSKD